MKNYSIEKITGDNHRPGMPNSGYLVRWGLGDYGWSKMQTFDSLSEAEEFAATLKESTNA